MEKSDVGKLRLEITNCASLQPAELGLSVGLILTAFSRVYGLQVISGPSNSSSYSTSQDASNLCDLPKTRTTEY